MQKTLKSEKRGSPLYPGMWECVGQIPAKLGHNEKLLKKNQESHLKIEMIQFQMEDV